MIKVFKHTGDDFSAFQQAEDWVASMGYSSGSMCGKEPIGLANGDAYIAKWYNLSGSDRGALDGTMTSTDFRDGDVIVTIKDAG